jgi:DNA-binding NtrC family response regulator
MQRGSPSLSSDEEQKLKLLVVDDDDLIIASLRRILPNNWSLIAVDGLTPIDTDACSAALVDLHLSPSPQAEGLDVLRRLREQRPQMELIAMSGDLRREFMEQGLKAGATRFLAKPIGRDELQITLEKIEALLELRPQVRTGQHLSELRWIGSGPASERLLRDVASLRGENAPVLIEGPSGAGKEVVAQLLHTQERRHDPTRPWVAVNLGALPESVFESEFFGHVKGAFTGADRDKMGLAECAQGGDLFLDEVEALPETQQAKLLRFLESGEVRRVGSSQTQKIKTRVIAATNRSLEEMVRQGEFREDLYFRLSGHRLRLPALKDRIEDLPALAEHFLSLERPRFNKTLAPDAIEALKKHTWPGQTRELRRICEQLALVSPLPLIRSEDVHLVLPQLNLRSPAKDGEHVSLDLSRGLTSLLERVEAQAIRHALTQTQDVDKAAELLGISRSSIYKKMKDYSIGAP